MTVELLGITWEHPRGYDPLVAAADRFQQVHEGVTIRWEKRSLQAFADFPIERLAETYDLLVIDHPHVGSAAASGCLRPLAEPSRLEALEALAGQSVGPSHASYIFNGQQWALAIDAAAQVAVHRPDRLAEPPGTWDAVLDLARRGAVLWPFKPVDALMSFFSIAANIGEPCFERPGEVIRRQGGLAVLEQMRTLAELVPPACADMSPIDVLEVLSSEESAAAYCPLLFGYSNYSREGFRPHLLRFVNIPSAGGGPRGSTIGGTGIAVSAYTRAPDVATDFAFWVAGADCQRGLYFWAGGQPGNAVAWEDENVNRASSNFFRDTRETLELSWLRPRHNGYLQFQERGGDILNRFLTMRQAPGVVLDSLEEAYDSSATAARR